jgi:hypothetical protein
MASSSRSAAVSVSPRIHASPSSRAARLRALVMDALSASDAGPAASCCGSICSFMVWNMN